MLSVVHLLWFLVSCSLVLGQLSLPRLLPRKHGHDGNDNGGDNDDGTTGTNSTGASTVPVTSSTAVNGTGGAGDSKCATLLCVSALVNSNSTVTYIMQSTGGASLGWMAIGFGNQMPNTPMVIMWPNANGSITLSQRQAPAQVMPTVVPSPPRIASTVNSLSAASSGTANPKLAFSIPANSDTTQNLIWAFASAAPSSSAVDATILQHLQSGVLQLDLTGQSGSFNPATETNGNGASGSGSGRSPGGPQTLTIPLLPYQKLLIGHAILCSLGFLFLLPTGVFIARYLRVVTPNWFKGHAYTQFWLSGPVILVGIVLGIVAVKGAHVPHFDDKHKVLGLALFIAYVVQCSLGAIIHWVKDPSRTRRPPQNYLHAVFGLGVIAASIYQVHLGFNTEWPDTTGRGEPPDGVETVWLVWTILISVAYFGGLVLLKKQFAHEKAAMARKSEQILSPTPSTSALPPQPSSRY